MAYRITQTDSFETEISVEEFDSFPTLREVAEIAYYVDKDDVKYLYKELIQQVGDWILFHAQDLEGFSEYNFEDGSYFLLEEIK